MHWYKSKQWRISTIIIGVWLLLIFIVCTQGSPVHAQDKKSSFIELGTATVQATPTEDPTVTALNKEKLAQEVKQLENQNEPDSLSWVRTNASIFLSTFVVVIGGLVGLWRWRADRKEAQDKDLEDRKADREKRAEERFQSAVIGLGDEKEGAQIGAAILLRTFLRKGYEQFYVQTFDLAVAHLRLQRTSNPQQNIDTPPLTTLSQALIMVFKEAYPLARSQMEGENKLLDASYIQLDNANLGAADLQRALLQQASMRNIKLYFATLNQAILFKANLSGADIQNSDLSEARLALANLSRATLFQVKLREADLLEANLSEADLRGADLRHAFCPRANLSKANLSKASSHMGDQSEGSLSKDSYKNADLRNADLSDADLSEADLSEADLSGADLSGATLSACKLIKAQFCLAMFFKGELQTITNDVSEAKLKAGKARFRGIEVLRVKLSGAHMKGADLTGARLIRTDLRNADLSDARFNSAEFISVDLSGARLNGTNIEEALSWENSNLRDVKGLTKEQLVICKAKGAIIDEDETTCLSQTTDLHSTSSQNDAIQTPPIQVKSLTSNPDNNNLSSSISDPE
ncbi:pentapeptide repeat-containing protein [Dictyobacter formicarum]|uniref:Pentapeptide repeat-containing protein n=1 Tax=Dictyobacter formicarum TaxID=2778368 RepID=A0ABQ3VIT4_9CHLR|nr:pentapeptide repeat-containing protein [Dictyobacter formicarum]GHO85599.1 hypothetical protein KSZ_36050 [Dictyobacter formicarum]